MTASFLLSPHMHEALWAYVGPGPGLSMLGALLSLLLTLGVALWAIALWPIRIMLRKRRERRERTTVQA